MSDEPLEVELTIHPDPSAPDEGPPPSRRLLHVGSRARTGAAVGLTVLVAVAGFVVTRDDGPDPDAVLRDAQDTVAAADSFEFRLVAQETRSSGGSHIGTDTTERWVANGEWSGEQWRVRSTTNKLVAEVVADGDVTYTRAADVMLGSVRDELWIPSDTDSPGAGNLLDSLAAEVSSGSAGEQPFVITGLGGTEEERINAAADVYLGVRVGGPKSRHLPLSTFGYDRSPQGLLEVMATMEPETVTEHPDGTATLTGRLRSTERFDQAFGARIPSARVVLNLDAERTPTRLRLRTRVGAAELRVDFTIRNWSGPVAVEVPRPEEVDQTPTVDEEHLVAAALDIDLVWPTAIPAGWEMTYLAVLPPDEPDWTAGTPPVARICDVIRIIWIEPLPAGADVEESAGYIRTDLTPLRCAVALDSTPFGTTVVAGQPARQTPFGDVEVQAGPTAVTLETWTLDPAQLDALVASLSRVDVATLIAQTPRN